MADTTKLTSKRTGLFDGLTEEEFNSIVSRSTPVEHKAGDLFVREGETGHELYIIVRGQVDIFTQSPAGDELLLAQLQAGDYFGEQALLSDQLHKRNASVRAKTEVVLQKVSYEDFRQLLDRDSVLRKKLVAAGKQQIRAKTLHQSSLFRTIKPEDLSGDWYDEKEFKDNEVVFREGDPADSLYLITSGVAEVYRQEGEGQKLLVKLREGQCFGELALLQRKPRAATVVAQESLKVIRIDGNRFIQLYEKNPGIREYLQTLQKVYSLTGRGLVTQHIGQFMGMEAITTIYHMHSGVTAIASHVIGKNVVNMTVSGVETEQAESLLFEDRSQAIKRELLISDNRIISVTAEGFWSELGRVYEMVLEQTPLDYLEIETFSRTGLILPEDRAITDDPDEVICKCLQVRLGTLKEKVQKNNCHAATELMKLTGAGTVCSSCRPLLEEIAEEKPQWMPVSLSQRIPVNKETVTLRFIPLGGKLLPAKPGQHIVVQGKIEDKWVQRPYTLTSPYNETSYREITIKKMPEGYFSKWLFDSLNHESTIRISQPSGEYFVSLSTENPIVCLVAGVGLTPALAIARAFVQSKTSRPLFIDYTVSNPEQFAYKEEFEALSRDYPNIKVNLRVTKEHGRLSEKDIRELIEKYPQADFFICGPDIYQDTVALYLRNCKVIEHSIHVETFNAPATDKVEVELNSRTYLYLGLGLFAAFFLQHIFNLKFGWLENWQTHETFKMWSGLAVTIYLLAQWYFPTLRIRKKSLEASRQYPIHKQLGALGPLLYYFHSTKLGFGFLFMLSTFFFANNLLGLINHDLVKTPEKRRRYSYYWLVPHIVLSLLIMALTIYHIVIAFFYEK